MSIAIKGQWDIWFDLVDLGIENDMAFIQHAAYMCVYAHLGLSNAKKTGNWA